MRVVGMSKDLPDGFAEWPAEAQRAYISRAKQKEQLLLAADALDVDVSIETGGSMTSRDLAEFVTTVLSEVAK